MNAAHPTPIVVTPVTSGLSAQLLRPVWLGLFTLSLAACQSVPLGAPAAVAGQAAATTHGATRPTPETAAPHAAALAQPPAVALVPTSAPTSAPTPVPSAAPAQSVAPEEEDMEEPNGWDISPELLAEASLWGRLRRGYDMPVLDHPLVAQHARRFARIGFFEGRERAERLRLYLPLIVQELEQRDMPLELAFLPLVESSLNPHAQSPVGATGTWQFMAPTARRFELRTSRLVDDRKNLIAATRAALDYLQKLYEQFDDWHLAMAAYNWGEGSVQKAINRQRAQGGPVDFASLAERMPAETRNYVPQILALASIVAKPQAYDARLAPLPDEVALVRTPLKADMDLSLVLAFSGLHERAFLAMNPSVKPPLVMAAATPQLLMPQDAAQRFAQQVAEHAGRRLAHWSVVRLASAQPVPEIAAAHGISAQAVRQANNIPAGMKPTAGSVLLLPVAPALGEATSGSLLAQASLGLAPDLVKRLVKPRKKETWAQLARRHGVSLGALADWNDVSLKRAAKGRPGPDQTVVLMLPRERAAQLPSVAQAKPAGQPALAPSAKPTKATPTAQATKASERHAAAPSRKPTAQARAGAGARTGAGTKATAQAAAKAANARRV